MSGRYLAQDSCGITILGQENTLFCLDWKGHYNALWKLSPKKYRTGKYHGSNYELTILDKDFSKGRCLEILYNDTVKVFQEMTIGENRILMSRLCGSYKNNELDIVHNFSIIDNRLIIEVPLKYQKKPFTTEFFYCSPHIISDKHSLLTFNDQTNYTSYIFKHGTGKVDNIYFYKFQ